MLCVCIIMVCLFSMGSSATAQTIVPPVVITTPGTYEITNDVQSIKDQTAITIESSDVTIDGNGCYIGGIGRDKSIGILVNKRGDHLTNVTISRIKLHDWDTGLIYRYVIGQEGDTNAITKNIILKCETGIEIDASDYITIDRNEISETGTGIQIGGYSNNIALLENIVDDNGYGINILDTSHIVLTNNQAINSDTYGIQISDATDTNLTRNSASENQYAGIKFVNVNDFEIVSNDISGSVKGGGIELGTGVSNGLVYDNYLRNRQNVEVKSIAADIAWNVTKQPGTNIVGGPYFAGNFWGANEGDEGYSQFSPDTEGWGICDDPYQIDTIHTDYLPLHYTDKRIAPETLEDMTSETENITETETKPVEEILTGKSAPAEQTTNQTEKPPQSVKTVQPTSDVAKNPDIVSEDETGSSLTQDNITDVRSQENDYHAIVVTNSYGDDKSDDTISADDLPVAENKTESEVTQSPTPGITPPLYTVGYYSIYGPDDATVFFITDAGVKVYMGKIKNGTLDFPVPVSGISYTSYSIEGIDFESVTGEITEFPETNETIIIDITEDIGSGENDNGTNVKEEVDETPADTSDDTVTISVTKKSGGSIIPGGDVEVRKGENITFTITPDKGYETAYLLFDGVKIGEAQTFTLEDLDADHSFTASFNQKP